MFHASILQTIDFDISELSSFEYLRYINKRSIKY